jgi:hypothetical protein
MTVRDLFKADRIILTVPLAAGIIAFVASQANTTHVFNPIWLPHARFHAVQFGLFFIALSGTGLWLIWGSAIGLPTAAWLAAAGPVVFWGESSPPCWSPEPTQAPTRPTPTPSQHLPPARGPRARQLVLLRLMIAFSGLGSALAITG